MILTGKVYDFFKNLALIYLPALGTFYATLAPIWHLPYADQIIGTILAVDTLLGVVLKISTITYDKKEKFAGTIDIETMPEGKKVFSLNVDGNLDELDQKEEITFRVNKT